MTTLGPITVNGVTIPAARIAAEAQMHPAPKGKPGQAWMAAARALVLREAMLQAARAEGLVPDPQALDADQVETEDEALIRQLLDRHLAPAPVEPSALRAVYDADPGRFRSPVLWEASHILLPADAVAAAQALLQDLLANPGRFADLAAQHSLCPSREAGGRLGQIGPGDLVAEVEVALDGMQPGEIAPVPVASRFGLHLLRLDARAEGQVLPWHAVEPRLRAAAEKAAWVRAARDFAEDLLSRAQIDGISVAGRSAA